MGNPRSGNRGKVLNASGSASVGHVTKYSLTKKAETDRFASSETSGYKATYAGPLSATGTVEGKFDSTVVTPCLEGAGLTLQLFVGNLTTFYSVPCVVSQFEFTNDTDSGAVIGFTFNFESNGTYVEPF